MLICKRETQVRTIVIALYVNKKIKDNDSVFHFVNGDEKMGSTGSEFVRVEWFLNDEMKNCN